MSLEGRRYDPKEVARLARERRFVTTIRVHRWLVNHDYDPVDMVIEALTSIETCGRWLSSCVLANSEIADEYLVQADAEEWYLKFYVDNEQVVVNVWSCWWEGVAH